MLHALLEYADREQLTPEPGLKPKTVRWLLVFSPQGALLGVQDLTGGDRRSKGREFRACPDLTQPEMVGIGGGCRHFLVDSLDVVVLLTKDGKVDAKQTAKHDFFVSLLEQAAESLPVLGAIADALRDEDVLEETRAKLIENKAKPMDLATLAVVDGELTSILVDRTDWRSWWQEARCRLLEGRKAKSASAARQKKGDAADTSTGRMRCLLSGELVEPMPTHNKIEGLADVGGLSMGDALTSFDKEAFGSYGLPQGANAAMSETAVKTYVTALNHLIRHRSRRIAGVKVAYWYSGRIEQEDDPIAELLEGFGVSEADESAKVETSSSRPMGAMEIRRQTQAESRARRLLDAIRTGERGDLAAFRYYALTLSANSGRVVIRDWMEGSFPELLESVNRWFDHLAIVSRDGSRVVATHKFAAVLAAPLRDLKDAAAPLVTAMWRCAVQRLPIPHQVMAQTLNRVRIDLVQDQAASHARLGLLKAFCNREKGLPKMTRELNEHETHPAYLCGRIMAILAAIQRTALPDVGAGVVQRYYAAASATPALVLGRLIRTAQIAHLPKIEGDGDRRGLRIWLESQLTEVWQQLRQPPPTALSLQEQTLFAMGYYHQLARQYQPRKSE